MIIAQISDTHIALDTPDSARRIRDFESTIEDINALDPQPDLIIHTGDIVQNGRLDEYAKAAAILATANVPVYLMVGNKDDRLNLRKSFSSAKYLFDDPEFITYSVESLPVRLLMLDTLNPGSNKGEFCEARTDRLIEMIDKDPGKPIAVFAHHPPFLVSEGPEPLHFETEEVMQRFSVSLQHSGSVIGLFCGHVHRGVFGYAGNIPVSVMPCIATPLRRGDYPSHMTTRPVYYLHRFDSDHSFSTEARIVNVS